MTLLRIPSDETADALEQRDIDLGNGTFVHLNRVAYMRISHRDAETAQHAANIARDRGLCFVPANIVCGMRKRIPGITMDDIRTEFTRRTAATDKPSPENDDRQQTEDFIRAMNDLFGNDNLDDFLRHDKTGAKKKPWWGYEP